MCVKRTFRRASVHVHAATGGGITTGGRGEGNAVVQTIIVVINGGGITAGLDVTNQRTVIIEGVATAVESITNVTALDNAAGHVGRSITVGRGSVVVRCPRCGDVTRVLTGCKRRNDSQHGRNNVEELFHTERMRG